MIPDHMPALNIPAIAEQPGRNITTINKLSALAIGSRLFMVDFLGYGLAMVVYTQWYLYKTVNS